MTEVVVYTQPNCQPCKATLRRFNTAGIPIKEVAADDYRPLLKARGHQAAPVVMTGEKHWSGYRPDLIDETINTRRNT
ncbi:glutaredoxin domain-containing protein [uncultured Microbacterium sp.]|uniref:glutaredoxin domain-containing protein n=1 Tax=uncultured Microbacterium sp. TaxID=191216 RepID=UPI0028E5E6F2|nr:glutaredoxin domain-containing protein [uncultured Microbacterium sp.]